MTAVHLFRKGKFYAKVAPGKNFDLGSNCFNSDTNAAGAAAGAAAAAAAAAAASAACINDVVLIRGALRAPVEVRH